MSRLSLPRARSNTRRRAALRERLPRPGAVADACGRALRRSVPVLLLGAIGGAIGGSLWAGHRFVTTSPRFAINAIEIRGNAGLAADDIRAALPFGAGDNIFRADLDDAERALEAEPWIADASVRRELPGSIVIELRERQAAAIVELGGLYLADADGRPFKRIGGATDETAGLPVVTGVARDEAEAAPELAAARVRLGLAALAAWRTGDDRPAVGEVHVGGRSDVTLYTYEDAVAIRLGEADGDALPARLATFDAAWAALGPDERRRARAIHVDDHARPDHVIVAFARN